MYKLYYSPGACSLAPHITFEELGLDYKAVQIDLRQAPSPEFSKISPLGAVPVIEMENGQALTEVAVILQYLADQKPDAGLFPRSATQERYRGQEWLNFIATELHKGFGRLFAAHYYVKDAGLQEWLRSSGWADLRDRFEIVSRKLGEQQYAMGSQFTIVDAYLFTILNWVLFFKGDLSSWPNLTNYMNRVRERPAVLRTLQAEGLM